MNTPAQNLTPEPAANAGPDCAPVTGSAWSYDPTGPLRRENEELKRELEKHKRWVEYLGKEGAALRAGINARLNGEKCPEGTWSANVEFAAKLECLVPNNQGERPKGSAPTTG